MVDFRNKNIKIDPKYLERDPNKQYVACVSYGKDSLAMLEVIKNYGLPLDRIITVEVWATDTIHADLPEMVEFKKKADKIILDRYGIEVEHIRANKTYEEWFYLMKTGENKTTNKKRIGQIYGFPYRMGQWCNDRLKVGLLKKIKGIHYVGIAVDEPKRLHSLNAERISPLVEAGWTEEMCRKWCEENDLLSPIYTTATRGGCWFCHNQGIDQLRLLRKNHPDLWTLLLKWDNDSPVSFKPDGHTVHDFDRRFEAEELGLVPINGKFRWKMLDKNGKRLDK